MVLYWSVIPLTEMQYVQLLLLVRKHRAHQARPQLPAWQAVFEDMCAHRIFDNLAYRDWTFPKMVFLEYWKDRSDAWYLADDVEDDEEPTLIGAPPSHLLMYELMRGPYKF